MSDINFCNTKEQLNHLGEVVTGKTNGSPTGADIETSTLPYTGQIRKTLPTLEAEYLEAIRNAGGEPLNSGAWAAGQTFTAYNQFMVYNDIPYKPLTTTPLPYGPTGATPDTNFVGPYESFSLKEAAQVFGNKNELSNSNFLTPSPDAITPPSATPEAYAAGTQIFSGAYAGPSGATITLINGRVNCTAGSYQFKLANTNGLERVPTFTSSVSDYDGIPKETGVSHVLVAGEYVVTVTPAAGDVFSVKLEQGSEPTKHEVGSLSATNLSDYTDIVYKASGGNSAIENMITGARIGDACSCENGSAFKRVSISNSNISDFELTGQFYFPDLLVDQNEADVSARLLYAFNNGIKDIDFVGRSFNFTTSQDASIGNLTLKNGNLQYTPSSAMLALTNYGQASGIYYSNENGIVEFDNFKITGVMDITTIGFVNGFCIHKAKELYFKNKSSASGFNYCGAFIGRTGKVNNSQDGYVDYVHYDGTCSFFGNRYSGSLLGEGDRASITSGNLFYSNGNDQDLLTGYGLAFYSNARFNEIIITGNYAFQNARKGFDLHSGKKAIITGNYSIANKLFGIYHNSVIDGEIDNTIADNHVDMRGYSGDTSNIPSNFEVFGILCRQTFQDPGPIAGEEMDAIIHDNKITMPDYPAGTGRLIPISVRNNAQLKKVFANVHDNVIKGLRCYGGVELQNVPRAGYDLESYRATVHDNYFDIGTLEAPLIWYNGATDFELITANDNTADIDATTFSQDAYIWLNTAVALGQFKTLGNTIKSGNPNKSVSIIDSYLVSVDKAQMLSEDNTINNLKEREWDGFRYVWWQSGDTFPVTGSWSRGSVINNYSASVGSTDAIVCTGGNDSGGSWAKRPNLV